MFLKFKRAFFSSFVLFTSLFLTSCTTLKLHGPIAPEDFPDLETHGSSRSKNPDIVYVLGGGGVKGVAHLAVLRVLENAGIRPDVIVGCSAGSIVGALYADYPSTTHLQKILFETSRSDLMTNLYSLHSIFSVSGNKKLRRFLETKITSRFFERLQIPLIVVATDLGSGRFIEFHKGDLVSAVMASAAVPAVFHPVKIHQRYFVDGGVVNNVPVVTAQKLKPKLIIAIDIGDGLTKKEPTNLLGIMMRSMKIVLHHQNQKSIRGADVLIQMSFKDIGLFDETRKQEIYDIGKQKALNALPLILKKMKKLGLKRRF